LVASTLASYSSFMLTGGGGFIVSTTFFSIFFIVSLLIAASDSYFTVYFFVSGSTSSSDTLSSYLSLSLSAFIVYLIIEFFSVFNTLIASLVLIASSDALVAISLASLACF